MSQGQRGLAMRLVKTWGYSKYRGLMLRENEKIILKSKMAGRKVYKKQNEKSGRT